MSVQDPAESTPTVTIIIPMRNESATIEACLDSVLASRLPEGMTLELLVLDGESSDDSAARVRGVMARDPRVRLLSNPGRLQAHAFNLGLAEARGRYVVRMDAHSLYADDYVSESIRLLEETGAENVGGLQRATGKGWAARAIAAAVSSRFAAGDAKYRHATEPMFTDTVYLGAWRVETLRRLGGMRTDWAVNEDYEMNVRLRAAGGRVYLSPTIHSTYFVRSSLIKLARQYFRYGFWKVRTLMEHPGSLRWRQLVPPAFVLSLLATPFLVAAFGWVGAIHLGLYVVASFLASVSLVRQHGLAILPLLPVVFAVIHCAWGTGFLAGLVHWSRAARRPVF
jgi:glycosyltransferase involved in cell wall biosynthesis